MALGWVLLVAILTQTTYSIFCHFIFLHQERQKSCLLADSILLREMAEELSRNQRQQHAGQSEAVSSVNVQEDKERSYPFQDVLK